MRFRHAFTSGRRLANQRSRQFHSNQNLNNERNTNQNPRPQAFRSRLRSRLRSTPIRWYPLPVGVGIALLLAIHIAHRLSDQSGSAPPPTSIVSSPHVALSGPWQVHVIGALPLRTLSRIYGAVNSYTLPVWFRVPGFRLYANMFGVNLNECDPEDLTQYRSLADFFTRSLKPGARPISESLIVSPADGTVVNFGVIENRRVPQIKGHTYSLDALLGHQASSDALDVYKNQDHDANGRPHVDELAFANVNGIPYSLDDLIGDDPQTRGQHLPVKDDDNDSKSQSSSSSSSDPVNFSSQSSQSSSPSSPSSFSESSSSSSSSSPPSSIASNSSLSSGIDSQENTSSSTLSVTPGTASSPSSSSNKRSDNNDKPDDAWDASVEDAPHQGVLDQAQVARDVLPSWSMKHVPRPGNKMFFTVVYLAPGDYHRFHSPANWVVERRRHFAGELFSVSPWMASKFADLFVLNERVSLLGRFRHGFFSMTAVGATNVGSIVVNFDKTLRTNRPRRGYLTPGTFAEATYAGASKLLGGQPIRAGDEIGRFNLGSTIVLVFEAPEKFEFNVQPGQKIKVGEPIGDFT